MGSSRYLLLLAGMCLAVCSHPSGVPVVTQPPAPSPPVMDPITCVAVKLPAPSSPVPQWRARLDRARVHLRARSYVAAEQQLLASLADLRAEPAANPLDRAPLLRMYAEIQATLGDFDTAIATLNCELERLSRIAEQTALAPDQESTRLLQQARLQILLGLVLSERRRADEALALYRQAVPLIVGSAETEQWERANASSNLADALHEQPNPSAADLSLARHYYEEVLSTSSAANLLNMTQNNFGLFLLDRGQREEWARAEELLMNSLHRGEKLGGPDNPELVPPLNNLAYLRLLQNLPAEAFEFGRRVLLLTERRLEQEGPALSEQRLYPLLQSLERDQANLHSVIAYLHALRDCGTTIPSKVLADWESLAMTTVLLRKQRSFDVLALRSNLSRKQPTKLVELVQALGASRRELAEISVRLRFPPYELTENTALSLRYNEVSQQIAAYEQTLAQSTAADVRRFWLAESHAVPIDQLVDRVRRALPANAVLLELVRYRHRSFGATCQNPVGQAAEQHYQAFVLSATGQLRVHDLGAAAPIDAAVFELRQNLGNSDSPLAQVTTSAQALFNRLLRPLWSELASAKTWILSLDGDVAQVPIAALHDGHDFLKARYSIGYVEAGRHLLRPLISRPSTNAVLIANPDFGPPLSKLIAECASVAPGRSVPQFCVDPLPSLPGTEEEANAFKAMLRDARLLTGSAATKAAVLQLHAPGLLLLATHGLSGLPDTEDPATQLHPMGESRGTIENPTDISDLYLRSLLALAEARRAYAKQQGSDGARGVLYARDALALDMHGTQLVILSACKSGLGTLQDGQGVLGMRRVFMATGSETVVSGLWNVADDATKRLMSIFRNNLRAGMGRVNAMNAAAQDLSTSNPLYAHPYYWAPFIVTGERGPLRGIFTKP